MKTILFSLLQILMRKVGEILVVKIILENLHGVSSKRQKVEQWLPGAGRREMDRCLVMSDGCRVSVWDDEQFLATNSGDVWTVT